jgi:hypothetical protein
MTVVEDILGRLADLGCRVELSNGGVSILGPVEKIPTELMAAARRSKPAIIVELLRQKASRLRDFIDGDASFSERLAKLPEYQEVTDELATAQEKLFDYYRALGFKVVWSVLLEEFVLVGDGSPPQGTESYVTYSWAEVEALKDANSQHVRNVHRIKKTFGCPVRPVVGSNGGSK